jgi:mannose-6-phosphate isomerase-like protein (cupin superfamily)
MPKAKFFIKTRNKDLKLKSNEDLFKTTMVEKTSFKFCISEPSNSKEVDMLPLKMVSKGIPVFLLNSPLENKLYPEFLSINSFEDIKYQMDKIITSFKDEHRIKDELHSFSCRNFFFSKMIDDIIRLYNNIFNNNKAFDKRPWGFWESLLISEQYKVKHFFVENNEQLSLQSHRYRDEIWMVVKGNGEITIDNEKNDVSKGDIFIIKRGQKHTIKGRNSGIDIIEIQTGDYLGEDDIFRYEDKYGRK